MSAHTPTPWFLVDGTEIYGEPSDGSKMCKDSLRIGDLADVSPSPIQKANAAHVVRCVNAHAELIAALATLVAESDTYDRDDIVCVRTHADALDKARATLAKVGAA